VRIQERSFLERGVRGATTQLPSPTDCIERVHKITALGVNVDDDQLTSTDHLSSLLSSCSSLLYALRGLRRHGFPTLSLRDVLEQLLWQRSCNGSTLHSCYITFHLKSTVPDLGVKVPDPTLEVPDLRSGGIRLNLTPDCAPVWYGFSSAADLNKLESFLRRCKRTGYCTPDIHTVTEQMKDADDKLFYSVLRNLHHML